MADINNILSFLDKVKRTGEGKWLALCSAHADRTPSLAIKETDDGKILIHCFAGCSVSEVVGSMGLKLSDLMPDNPEFKKGSRPPRFNKYELFDIVIFEVMILYVAIKQILNKSPLSTEDQQRVEKAMEVIFDIKREVGK